MAALLRAAPLDERVEALFRPLVAEMITLSPDGQRVAYTTPAGRDLTIGVMSLEPPGAKRTIPITPPEREDAAAPGDAPTRLRFLRWATATRLVFAPTERVVPLPPVPDEQGRLVPNRDGPIIISPIIAVDADGRQRGTLVDARNFQETPAEARKTLADLLRTPQELQATRSEPIGWRMPHLDVLGFLPSDRSQLILRTHGGYSVPMQHLVDIHTGTVREFGGDWPVPPGEPQVFDWYRLKVVGERTSGARPTTAWRDEELGRVQRELERKFPRRIVEILDWSETRTRVLFRVTGGSDPGRIFLYQRPEDLVLEFLRRAPWLGAAKLHETRFFEFAAPDGARLSGYVTWPRRLPSSPPPLLLLFPSGFPGHAHVAFDPEAQVLADFGFVVARLNHRSLAGMRMEDLNRLRTAIDRVSIDDARAAVDWLATQNPTRPFDRGRLVTFGRGFGGYLAVRALQLQPAVFRCGIAIDAPMELRSWLQSSAATNASAATPSVRAIPAGLFDHPDTDWKKLSVIDHAETLTRPVLLLVEPKRSHAIDASTAALRTRLQGLDRTLDHIELDPGFAGAQPASRAAAYRKIEEFLNVHLHGHAVKVDPTQDVK